MIPFNRPAIAGRELEYVREVLHSRHLSGDGAFTIRCQRLLEDLTGTEKALLTHSCTGALEMAAILSQVGPGDEVIMPSFTFVSTANAFVLRGATPVFVDVRHDTFNIDECLVEEAVTERTKVIVPVHYAGVSCEMNSLMSIAAKNGLLVVEDAAQAVGSAYRGSVLGAIGQLGTLSFHETKNVISGEGGALLVNDPTLAERAEIIREKGTNRSAFFRGQIDKYSWVDVGSSYLPSEIVAAFLCAQLEDAGGLTIRRRAIWDRYHEAFATLEQEGRVRRPVIPDGIEHNGHIYYLVLPDLDSRTRFIDRLKSRGVAAAFHYVPLHSSPAGLMYGRSVGDLPVTTAAGERVVRLPIWVDIEEALEDVIEAVCASLDETSGTLDPHSDPLGKRAPRS